MGSEAVVAKLGDHEWIYPRHNRRSGQQRCAKCGLWRTKLSELRSCPPDDEDQP